MRTSSSSSARDVRAVAARHGGRGEGALFRVGPGRPSARRRWGALALLALAAVSLAACGGSEPSGGRDGDPAPGTTAGAPAAAASGSAEDGGVRRADGAERADGAADRDADADAVPRVVVTVDGTALTGRLDDNATARDLAAQLPRELSMSDHNGAEKTGALPRPLSTDGAPAGHDPRAGDLGYFAPGGDLVLYYDDAAPYFDGIVRIGRLFGDLGALRGPSDVRVSVERAGNGR